MAEKGWSRTIRATYATQLGFEDRYGHRAVSFPQPASALTTAEGVSPAMAITSRYWIRRGLALLSPLGTCDAYCGVSLPGTGPAAPASGRSPSRYLGARPSWPLAGWKPALLALCRRPARRRGTGGRRVMCCTIRLRRRAFLSPLGRGGPGAGVGRVRSAQFPFSRGEDGAVSQIDRLTRRFYSGGLKEEGRYGRPTKHP